MRTTDEKSPTTPMSHEEELRRFAEFIPRRPTPTGKHDPWIDCWRAERVRFEVARAAGVFQA